MASTKTLEQWISKIEGFNSSEIELGLSRVEKLAKQLDLLSFATKVVTVGGTNGKGSCVAMLESLAIQSGLNVGTYTSPHLRCFNERIKINGVEVSDEQLIMYFELLEAKRKNIQLTFFEFTTLVALLIFKQQEPDLIVLEVGLGGRLDAVNIVEPDVSIITTIDKDHENWLGSDPVGIAFEKSGIYRADKKNLVGDKNSLDLILKARPEFQPNVWLVSAESLSHVASIDELIQDPNINKYCLLAQNLNLAIGAFDYLFQTKIQKINLAKAIKNIKLEGRFQKVSECPLIIVDVGHNLQAAKNLKSQLTRFSNGKKWTVICGMMRDKAIDEVLQSMDFAVDCWHFVDLPSDRAATSQQLSKIYQLANLKRPTSNHESVSAAYKQICDFSSDSNSILVFGSFVTVAEMLHYFDQTC